MSVTRFMEEPMSCYVCRKAGPYPVCHQGARLSDVSGFDDQKDGQIRALVYLEANVCSGCVEESAKGPRPWKEGYAPGFEDLKR